MEENKILEKRHVEILSPAGSYEAMTAAASGGCDAVYAAGSRYGARAFAKNFSIKELILAADYLHLRGKKLYIAMNTLIKEEEMDKELFNTLKTLYEEGADGIIVQDTGLMSLIHEEFPLMPIHASTQVSIASPYGAGFLKQLGITRIVPARECSLRDIRLLKENTGMEIECFVHGALCFSYSGLCLFSSMCGERSGNRGRCAQPCRMPYSLKSSFIKGQKNGYILSPRDICTLELIPDLIEAGIDSFKIEGRMKNPEYCALTAFLYKKYSETYYEYGREYYEERILNEKGEKHQEFLRDLWGAMDVFNRGGFSKGYYYCHNGKKMMSDKRQNHFGSMVGMVTKAGIENGTGSACKGRHASHAARYKITIMPYFDIRKDDVLEVRDSMENTVLLINGSKDFKEGREEDFYPYGLTWEKKNSITALFKREGKLKLYRLRNHRLSDWIKENFLKESVMNKKTPFKEKYPFLLGIPAEAFLSGEAGTALSLTLVNGERKITVSANEPLSLADKEGFNEEKLSMQINKTGEYPFLIDLDTKGLSKDCFIPMPVFNQLRREAVKKLAGEIISSCKRKYFKQKRDCRETKKENYNGDKKALVMACSVFTIEQAEEILRIAREKPCIKYEIILNGAVCSPEIILKMLKFLKDKREGGDFDSFPKIYISMPSVFSSMALEKFSLAMPDICGTMSVGEISGFYARTIDEAGYLKKHFKDADIRLESTVYQWNKRTQAFFSENGILYNTLSLELSYRNLKSLDLSHSYLLAYGCQNLMVSSQCLVKNYNGCRREDFYEFKNEAGKPFFGINVCPYCYNLIFETVPRNLISCMDIIREMGLYGLRFDFYRETPREAGEILLSFSEAYMGKNKGTKEASFKEQLYEGRFLKGTD